MRNTIIRAICNARSYRCEIKYLQGSFKRKSILVLSHKLLCIIDIYNYILLSKSINRNERNIDPQICFRRGNYWEKRSILFSSHITVIVILRHTLQTIVFSLEHARLF